MHHLLLVRLGLHFHRLLLFDLLAWWYGFLLIHADHLNNFRVA